LLPEAPRPAYKPMSRRLRPKLRIAVLGRVCSHSLSADSTQSSVFTVPTPLSSRNEEGDLAPFALPLAPIAPNDSRLLWCHKLEGLPNPLRNFSFRSAFGLPIATLCFQISFLLRTFAFKLFVFSRNLPLRLCHLLMAELAVASHWARQPLPLQPKDLGFLGIVQLSSESRAKSTRTVAIRSRWWVSDAPSAAAYRFRT